MIHFIQEALSFSWLLFRQAAPFFLFGLVLAGVIRLFLSPEYIARHLGRRGLSSILKAALAGIPLPLCSCSVLPVAASLKKQGADKGGVSAFLISTPESGVDSILISWALLDPVMTVARPLAALMTAVAAGLFQNLLDKEPSKETGNGQETNESAGCTSCGCNSSCCSSSTDESQETKGFLGAVKGVFYYAFFDLWEDLAGWFFAGLLVAGIISAILPQDFFSQHLGGGIESMLLMLVVGIPLYICATASTPIAAALILKGMSPGTALVFLLVGPATNVTSLSVLLGILGRTGTVIYLATIAVFSVVFGLILDAFYAASGIVPSVVIGKAAEIVPDGLMTFSALLLVVMFLVARYKSRSTQIMHFKRRTK